MKLALLHVDDIKYFKNITISAIGAELMIDYIPPEINR